MTKPTIGEIVTHRARIVNPTWQWERIEDDAPVKFPITQYPGLVSLRTTWPKDPNSPDDWARDLPVFLISGAELDAYEEEDLGGVTAEFIARSPEYVDRLLEELDKFEGTRRLVELETELHHVRQERDGLRQRLDCVREMTSE